MNRAVKGWTLFFGATWTFAVIVLILALGSSPQP